MKHYLIEMRSSGAIETFNIHARSEYEAIQEAMDRCPYGRVGRVTLLG